MPERRKTKTVTAIFLTNENYLISGNTIFTCSSSMGLRSLKMYYYFRDSYGFVTYVHPDSAAYAVESTYYNVLVVDANIIVLDKNCDFHDYPFHGSVSPSEFTIWAQNSILNINALFGI